MDNSNLIPPSLTLLIFTTPRGCGHLWWHVATDLGRFCSCQELKKAWKCTVWKHTKQVIHIIKLTVGYINHLRKVQLDTKITVDQNSYLFTTLFNLRPLHHPFTSHSHMTLIISLPSPGGAMDPCSSRTLLSS